VGIGAQTGVVYMVTALVTGGAYTSFAWSFARRPAPGPARRLFLGSLAVLPILLLALVVDVLIR
jgi:heme O synthase-like polyprenyltransferase